MVLTLNQSQSCIFTTFGLYLQAYGKMTLLWELFSVSNPYGHNQ